VYAAGGPEKGRRPAGFPLHRAPRQRNRVRLSPYPLVERENGGKLRRFSCWRTAPRQRAEGSAPPWTHTVGVRSARSRGAVRQNRRVRAQSCRSASIGSSLAARWAGYQPNSTPTPTDTNSDRKIAGTCTFAGSVDPAISFHSVGTVKTIPSPRITPHSPPT